MATRLSTRQKKQIDAGGPPPRTIGPDDNLTAEQKLEAKEEAERVQLISFVSRLTQADAQIEEARAPLTAAQAERSKLVGLAKAAGFTAKELKARMEEMRTPTRKMASLVLREGKQRRWLGIVEPDQSDLLNGTAAPEEAKDEAHWKGEGYKAGLRLMMPKPPTECPERFVQPWMQEHERGYGEATAANAPKKTPKPVAQQAAEDFKEDNPEVDVDEAARRLRADPKFMDRTSEPPVSEEALGAVGAPAGAVQAPSDEGFEASEEELAGQTTRQAVVGERAADDEPVV